MSKKISKILTVIFSIAFACLTLTGCSTSSDEGSSASGISSIVMLVVLVVVFYFFLIRPENKKKKKLEQMRNELSNGDKVTTIGGIVGKIVSIDGDLITIETGEDRVRIQITKWAISTNGIQKKENEEPQK